MPLAPHLDRRTYLRATGTAATIALVGCLGAESPAPGDTDGIDEDESDPSMPDAKATTIDRIAADPADVPPPVDWTDPQHHEVTLRTEEHTAEVEPGVTFDYMTFEGQIPGPMIRVRQGDTIRLRFEVPDDLNDGVHNVDFHAVYGPGGGAEATTVRPGETAEIQFKVMYPGVFTYHCAVPDMDWHISAGMFGAILVEPKEGLPAVDREFYFGQHELYTQAAPGEAGHHRFDFDAVTAETPTYVLLNGEAYGFTADRYGPLHAEVGETVRVYFVNGGPNLTSAWHPIGNVWSRLYRDGDLVSPPAQYVDTTPVAPGTATAGEMDLVVPGPIKLVDHALSRVLRRGLLAVIDVTGDENRDVYDPNP